MKRITPTIALILAAALPTLRAAEPSAAVAAALIAANQDALVEIKATLHIHIELAEGTAGGTQQPTQVQSAEARGVVIHSSGLIAAPLALLNLTSDKEIETPQGKIKLSIRTSIDDAKIVTADGREYGADVILRAPDAGLVLLKLSNPPEEGLTSVALIRDLPAPPPFAQLLDMARLGAELGRAPTVRVLRMAQSMPLLVPLYQVIGTTLTPGSAVFDLSGRFLGLSVIPIFDSGGNPPDALPMFPGTGPCILPTSEILRIRAIAFPDL